MVLQDTSFLTTPVEILNDEDQELGAGTGFYYVSEKKHLFIITNRHVLSSRTYLNGQKRVRFYFHTDSKKPDQVMGITMPLYTDSGEPIWLEHEDSAVDIAVIPFPYSFPFEPHLVTLGESSFLKELKAVPTQNVTLVGYPKNFLDRKNYLPVYRAGHIASEPDVDFDGKPYFLINIIEKKGNSGSPVFSTPGFYFNEAENTQSLLSPVKKFLGVYSGNIEDEGIQHDLGIVWHPRLISEITEPFVVGGSYRKIAENLAVPGKFQYKLAKGFPGA